MATCSSLLAWKIPQTEEPGRLQSLGTQRQIQLSTHAHINCSLVSLPPVTRRPGLMVTGIAQLRGEQSGQCWGTEGLSNGPPHLPPPPGPGMCPGERQLKRTKASKPHYLSSSGLNQPQDGHFYCGLSLETAEEKKVLSLMPFLYFQKNPPMTCALSSQLT